MTKLIKKDFVTACTLLNPNIFHTPIYVAFAEIMMMKIILLISPPTFIQLNNYWFKRTCLACLFLPFIHLIYHYARYDGYCIKNMAVFVLRMHKINVEPDKLEMSVPIVRPIPYVHVSYI